MMHHCELITSSHFVQIVEEYSNALPVSLVPFIAAIHNSFNACSVVMSMALAVYKKFPQTSCVVLILFCLTNGGAHHNYSQKIVIFHWIHFIQGILSFSI